MRSDAPNPTGVRRRGRESCPRNRSTRSGAGSRSSLRMLPASALLALVVSAPRAGAHPLPVSYVDLRLDGNGIEARVEVPTRDLAHDLPPLSETTLLAPATLRAHRAAVAGLLVS